MIFLHKKLQFNEVFGDKSFLTSSVIVIKALVENQYKLIFVDYFRKRKEKILLFKYNNIGIRDVFY